MPLELWLAFVATCILFLPIPGPTVLLVMSYALTQGRRVAVGMALGVALGDLVAMVTCLVGLGALVMASATLFTVLKWVGAVYLVYLGVKLLRAPPARMDLSAPDEKPARNVFWHAAAVTALNPKSIPFFIAFVPQFMSTDSAFAPQAAILTATFVGLAAVNALAYALLADKLRRQIRRPSVLTWMNRMGAGVLITMGLLTTRLSRN